MDPALHKFPDITSADPNYDDFILSYDTTFVAGIVGSVVLGLIFLGLFLPLFYTTFHYYSGFLPVFTRGASMTQTLAESSTGMDDMCDTHFRPLRLTVIFMSGFGCVAFAFFATYGARMADLDERYTHSGLAELLNITTDILQQDDDVLVFADMAWDFCPLSEYANDTGTKLTANDSVCRSRMEISSCSFTDPCTISRSSRPRKCSESDLRGRAASAKTCVRRILGNDPFSSSYLGDEYFANNNETCKVLVQCPCTRNFNLGQVDSTNGEENQFLNANIFTIEDPYADPVGLKQIGYFLLIAGGAWSVAVSLFCGVFLGEPPWKWGGKGFCGCGCFTSNNNDDDSSVPIPKRELKKLQREFTEMESAGHYDNFSDERLRATEEMGIKVDWDRRRQRSNS